MIYLNMGTGTYKSIKIVIFLKMVQEFWIIEVSWSNHNIVFSPYIIKLGHLIYVFHLYLYAKYNVVKCSLIDWSYSGIIYQLV
jgi:hypothetical protein